MTAYRFYLAADKRQDEIWDYTLENWDERQAENYIRGFHRHLQELADKKLLWRNLPNHIFVPSDLDMNIYFSVYGYHYLFLRELSNGDIGVMSILHKSMDLPTRFHEDLERIKQHDSSC